MEIVVGFSSVGSVGEGSNILISNFNSLRI